MIKRKMKKSTTTLSLSTAAPSVPWFSNPPLQVHQQQKQEQPVETQTTSSVRHTKKEEEEDTVDQHTSRRTGADNRFPSLMRRAWSVTKSLSFAADVVIDEVNHTSKDQMLVQGILDQFTDCELETVARASYELHHYNDVNWSLNTNRRINGKQKLFETKHSRASESDVLKFYAAKTVQRYLVCFKQNPQKVMEQLKKTVQFRNEMGIDRFVSTNDSMISTSSNGNGTADYLMSKLRNFLSSKKLYVQGYDRCGRSTYYFIPRNVETDYATQDDTTLTNVPNTAAAAAIDYDAMTMFGHIYTIERAITCSRCDDKSINAIVDFNGFNPARHAPSLAVGKNLLNTLSSHYIHYINNIYIVDAPVAFLYLWNVLFKKFTCKTTSSKIQFVRSRPATTKRNNKYNKGNTAHGRNTEVDDDVANVKFEMDDEHFKDDHKTRENQNSCNRLQQQLGSSLSIEELYTKSEIPSWIVSDGSKNRPFDVVEYLDRTPFHHAFDE